MSKIVKSQIESNSQHCQRIRWIALRCVKDRQITNWKQFTTNNVFIIPIIQVCQRSSNHKLKAIHNKFELQKTWETGVSKIVKSQIESNSQRKKREKILGHRCVKDRQITNWKQFTTYHAGDIIGYAVCQRSSNHKLKAIHNRTLCLLIINSGVSKIVKSQIESNSQLKRRSGCSQMWCVKDRQITNWKQFTTEWYQSLA